jgi:hypothetical protein
MLDPGPERIRQRGARGYDYRLDAPGDVSDGQLGAGEYGGPLEPETLHGEWPQRLAAALELLAEKKQYPLRREWETIVDWWPFPFLASVLGNPFEIRERSFIVLGATFIALATWALLHWTYRKRLRAALAASGLMRVIRSQPYDSEQPESAGPPWWRAVSPATRTLSATLGALPDRLALLLRTPPEQWPQHDMRKPIDWYAGCAPYLFGICFGAIVFNVDELYARYPWPLYTYWWLAILLTTYVGVILTFQMRQVRSEEFYRALDLELAGHVQLPLLLPMFWTLRLTPRDPNTRHRRLPDP